MYFLNSDGSIRSYSADRCFGWWLQDFDRPGSGQQKQRSKRVCVYCVTRVRDVQQHRAVSVERPNVSQEVAATCRRCDNFDTSEPNVANLLALVNKHDPKQWLLIAVAKPSLWTLRYQRQYNEINLVPSMKRTEQTVEATGNLQEIRPKKCTKIRWYPDDPGPVLLAKLAQLTELLASIREEMVGARVCLQALREDFEHDDMHVSRLIQETACFTRAVYDAQYLDSLILLLNGHLSSSTLPWWPAGGQRTNYIV